MIRRRSLRFRLTAWYAAILTAGLGCFGALIWLSLRHQLLSEIDQDLEGRASRFERYFRTESAEGKGPQLRDELEEFCQALAPANYIEVHGSSGFSFRCPPEATPAGARVLDRTFNFDGVNYALEVGAPVGAVLHTLALLRIELWSLLPVVIAIACIGGAWLSGRALKPVSDITKAALTISIENLSERLPVPGTGDELARLTEVLNTMLARLESAVRTLSQFVADASHELRTPLAVIRTTAELALRRDRSADSYRESLEEVAAETARMTQLVEDLLTLARGEGELAAMPRTPLDVRDVLRDVCTEMRTLAETRDICIQSRLGEQSATISANPPALHRLFLLLLDNALKYSRPGGEVILSVERTADNVAVTIEDFGAGISPADLPHIFERFYRADRSRTGGGHGLGLSLAESIARIHGASIEVRSTEGAWSMFRVLFSACEARPETVSANLKVEPVD